MYFLSTMGLLNAAPLLWVSSSNEYMPNTGEVSKRHYGDNNDSWQLRTQLRWGKLTWGNSSDRWWWFCCPTSRDPGPYPQAPWMLLETDFISPQQLWCRLCEETNTTWHHFKSALKILFSCVETTAWSKCTRIHAEYMQWLTEIEIKV